MRRILFTFISFFTLSAFAQMLPVENPYQHSFELAYQTYPDIPKGLLEAVSYNQTRITHLTPEMPVSCTGMPQYLGVMGLIEDGKGYFSENLQWLASMSGETSEAIKKDPNVEILAFAKVFNLIMHLENVKDSSVEVKITMLSSFTEIPLQFGLEGNYYAFDAYLYGIVSFMNDPQMQAYYNFPNHKIRSEKLFGTRLNFLSSPEIFIHNDHIENGEGDFYPMEKSADYAPALWNPAASCNYSSRNGVQITAVTVHTVQGTYAGCISWFQNCNAGVSCHYVMRSSDGQVTQQVLEANKAWHVGNNNPYTVGIEHEGYVNNAAWYTTAMYNSSAALTIDIANSNSINKIRTGWWPWLSGVNHIDDGIPGACVLVKGHQHYPNQTHSDPGINWDWNRYYKLINTPPAATVLTAGSGNFFDSGGNAANYINDERSIWTISPSNAATVTVTFSSFNLENTWDYLYVYDGADLNAPLIGYYTGTNNPGTISSSGGALTFEFRSDCATTAAGWQATYSSANTPSAGDSMAPVSSISINGTWQTTDFAANYSDADEAGGSGLEKAYYSIAYTNSAHFYSNPTRGFFRDDFDATTLNTQWSISTGTWNQTGGILGQSDESIGNTNIYASLKQDLSNVYVYEFSAAIGGSGTNRRGGFHFFCDSAQLTNRGNSYFIWLRVDQQVVEIYKVTNDVFSLVHSEVLEINAGQFYNYRVLYDRTTGNIKMYQDNVLITGWTDVSPYTSGKYISFRTGNANMQVGNVKVYRSRAANSPTFVTVGNCGGCELIYQNNSPFAHSGIIQTFSKDSAGNFSPVVTENIHVDWTSPDILTYVNDISIFDEDTTTNNSLVGGNWNSGNDVNSGIARYWYSIGTIPGDSNIVPWQDNWFYTNFTDTLSLLPNQWYYINARAENNAGLINTATTSDGFVYLNLSLDNTNAITLNVYPNPANQLIYINGLQNGKEYTASWITMEGKFISTQKILAGEPAFMNIPAGLPDGMYVLNIQGDHSAFSVRIRVVR